MPELKNIRIAVSGLYDYAFEELPTLRVPLPGNGAPDWVEEKRLYKVYRPAPVLAAACPKFASLPLTHHHPKTPVDGVNFRDLAIGWTGEHPEVDYIAETDEVGIRSTCVLYDDEALSAYENGEVQLSPGYIAVFEWKKGTAPNGEEYDIVMKEITDVNHLALLPNGRGGKYAVVMDEAVKERSVFDMIRNRREVLDYGTVFDLVQVQTKDVKYEDGHVSHRKDGNYVKREGKWEKVAEGQGNAGERVRQEKEAKKLTDFFTSKGYESQVSVSNASWGSSTYITPYKDGKPLFINSGTGLPRLVKFRISDHPTTSAGRDEINIKSAEEVIKSIDAMEQRVKEYKEESEKRTAEAKKKIEQEQNAKKESLSKLKEQAGDNVKFYTETVEMSGDKLESGSAKLREALKNNRGFVAFNAGLSTSPYAKTIYYALPADEENTRKGAKEIEL